MTEGGIDIVALRRWLTGRLDGLGEDLAVERLPGGQSNPSWILRSGDHRWVLRCKPAPRAELLPSAHAIEREFAVQAALHDTPVPVARMDLLCEDEDIIGVAFYVMEYIEGRIFRDAWIPGVPAEARQAYISSAVGTLAALHTVAYEQVGLAAFGRHSNYFERLISRWTRQYRGSETQTIPPMERLIDWLPANIPVSAENEVSIVHGDYRLENLVFHPEEPMVTVILDWELSTLGHPLADLAYFCMAWHSPSGEARGFADKDLAALGLPTEEEVIAEYCHRAGRTDVDRVRRDWGFYLACNYFRAAAIFQGITKRVLDGTASGATAEATGRLAAPIAEIGWRLAHSP